MRRIMTGLAAVAMLWLTAGAALAQEVVLYKNPQCGCCQNYATLLSRAGLEVEVQNTENLEAVNRQLGVPTELAGCHTMTIAGYAVSGHVPFEALSKLLQERPAVRGIALPGMPTGAPGMGGPKEEPFTVYAFGEGGVSVYAVE